MAMDMIGRRRKQKLMQRLYRNRYLWLLMLPGILYFLFFRYAPMWGLIISFMDYRPYVGLFQSPWVGWANLERFLNASAFQNMFRNTLAFAGLNLLLFFPAPIILALMLNEVGRLGYKRTIQSLVYMPHFISWVVVVSFVQQFFNVDSGLVTLAIRSLSGQKVNFLMSAQFFRPLIIIEMIWKETGWGTILFLAALSNVDAQLYEAAKIDGANRWHQLWVVTLPAIKTTVITLFILRLGTFLDTGFEQIFLQLNAMNRSVGEVFDTYVYKAGIQQGDYSYATTIGMFKSVFGLVLIVIANAVIKKTGEEGLY